MPVEITPGTDLRVKLGTVDASTQITGGGTTFTPNVERIRTLSDIAYPKSDREDTATVEFVYNEDVYQVLYDNTKVSGASFATEITSITGTKTWSCPATHVTNLSAPFQAEDGAIRATADLAGEFDWVDAPVGP